MLKMQNKSVMHRFYMQKIQSINLIWLQIYPPSKGNVQIIPPALRWAWRDKVKCLTCLNGRIQTTVGAESLTVQTPLCIWMSEEVNVMKTDPVTLHVTTSQLYLSANLIPHIIYFKKQPTPGNVRGNQHWLEGGPSSPSLLTDWPDKLFSVETTRTKQSQEEENIHCDGMSVFPKCICLHWYHDYPALVTTCRVIVLIT